tara:strand:- start:4594 stop:5064 length:471 start_codon:yes stop_codon:yes gene_type:complete
MADHKVLTLEFDDSTTVDLLFEGGCDVIHCNDDYHENVFSDTGVFETLAMLVVSENFSDNNILQSMREHGLLDHYNRGDYNFENHVVEIMQENNWDYEFVEGKLEQYDHKRGFYRVQFSFSTDLGTLKSIVRNDPNLVAGLDVIVHTDVGQLTVCD